MSAVSQCGRSGAMLAALQHQQWKGQSWKWGRMMRRNSALGQAPLNSSILRRACHRQPMQFTSAGYVMENSALGGAALPVSFLFHWLYCRLGKHDTTSKQHCASVCIEWGQLSVLAFPAFWIKSRCMLCYFLFPDSSLKSPGYFRNVIPTRSRFLGSLLQTHTNRRFTFSALYLLSFINYSVI